MRFSGFMLVISTMVAVMVDPTVFAISDQLPALFLSGQPENPGLKIRVTKKGVADIGTLLGKLLNKEIPNIRIAKAERELPYPATGKLILSDVQVVKFKEPTSYSIRLQAPDQILLSATSLDIEMVSDYVAVMQTTLATTQSAGQASVNAERVSFELRIAFERVNAGADAGKPRFRTIYCDAEMNSATIDYTANAANFFESLFLISIKPFLQQNARSLVRDSLCRELNSLVDGILNKKYSTMAAKIPLVFSGPESEFGDVFNFSSAKLNFPVPEASDDFNSLLHLKDGFSIPFANFSYDYRLTRKPTISKHYLETEHRGEISYLGRGDTPFYPNELAEPKQQKTHGVQRMLYIYVSDYVFNSLFYAAYKNTNVLTISRNSLPNLDGFLRTTCDYGITVSEQSSSLGTCFGELFESAQRQFPNHAVEINIVPTSFPSMLISSDAIRTEFSGLLSVSGSKLDKSPQSNSDLWLVANITITGQTHIDIDSASNSIRGSIRMKQCEIRVISSKFDSATDTEFQAVAKLGAELVEEKINRQLSHGLPIPMLAYGQLISPKIHLLRRTVVIEADMKLDENKISAWMRNHLLA